MLNKNKAERLHELLNVNKNSTYGFYDASKKASFHKENFSSFLRGKDFDVKPISVEIVPSLECNFSCPGCTYKQNGSKFKIAGRRRLLRKNTFDKIVNNLRQFGVKSLIFTGGGEPMMNPITLQFIEEAKKYFKVGLYTNGLLWDAESIKKLMKMNISFVRISLNADDFFTHSKVFGYQNVKTNYNIYKKVIDNIIEFSKEKEKSETVLGLGYLVNEKNFKDPLKTYDALWSLFKRANEKIDHVAFRPEVAYFDNDFNTVFYQPNANFFKEIYSDLKKVSKELNNSGFRAIFNSDGFDCLTKKHEEKKNIAASWSVSFNYDGKLYLTSEGNGLDYYLLGDINLETMNAIWYGKRRKELISSIKTLPNFKLKTLNDLLLEIRNIGKFNEKDIKEFYKKYDKMETVDHIDFI